MSNVESLLVLSVNSDEQPLIKLQRHLDAEKCHHQQIDSSSELVLHNKIDGSRKKLSTFGWHSLDPVSQSHYLRH